MDKSDEKTLAMTSKNIKLTSARLLLERAPEDDYIDEWTHLLAFEKEKDKEEEETSVVIFRLAREWLALRTVFFMEITPERNIHRIPHRSDQILLGMVNLRGRLTLCVDMRRLLEIEADNSNRETKEYGRMAAIQKDQDLWIFPVDEVHGIFHCNFNRLENVPVTVAKSKANYIKGVISWYGHGVGLLDEELLFFSLKRSVL